VSRDVERALATIPRAAEDDGLGLRYVRCADGIQTGIHFNTIPVQLSLRKPNSAHSTTAAQPEARRMRSFMGLQGLLALIPPRARSRTFAGDVGRQAPLRALARRALTDKNDCPLTFL
jgi:hypothetical protein